MTLAEYIRLWRDEESVWIIPASKQEIYVNFHLLEALLEEVLGKLDDDCQYKDLAKSSSIWRMMDENERKVFLHTMKRWFQEWKEDVQETNNEPTNH